MASSDDFGGVLVDIVGLGVVLVIGYLAFMWLSRQTVSAAGATGKTSGLSLGLGNGASSGSGIASNGQQLLNSLEQMIGGSTAGLNPTDSDTGGDDDIPLLPTDDSGDFWDLGTNPILTDASATLEPEDDTPDDGEDDDIGD